MSVLVLGGSGYLGTAVATACRDAGDEVLVLSRRGTASVGEGLRGDVRAPGLGLSRDDLARVKARVTHVVLAFGSVSWRGGPGETLETHDAATRSVLGFLRGLPALEQAVHVSSLLVMGRAEGRVSNRELYVGQTFRNWYEYGKYCAERHVRDATDLPVGVVRFGPVLGPDPRGGVPDTRTGLQAAIPHVLAGYPVHLVRRGEFPSWASDVMSAGEVVRRALTAPIGRATWTWFDPAMPSTADVLTEVCRPWGVVPRIVEARLFDRLSRLVGARLGLAPELLDYAEPWLDLDPAVLDDIPRPWPRPEPDYLGAMGRALLGRAPAEAAR
ncbi:NAD-dependent epimerase/dehydratase family protein [Saccharothrix syringae]|uniref:NAD-dependent epimerase/dehydratase family protein n=1 Tax=Saccharothrix syringae TaxID=103733 RepID=A0A5Q0H434_SACSY|nr:SDR family oxidoreductase [Saccharothrix syringae]QFZ20675.1 NAD-dependent epimerase/dehydratase family protein [Saccharothrix syringae]